MKSSGLGRGFLFGRMLELIDWPRIRCELVTGPVSVLLVADGLCPHLYFAGADDPASLLLRRIIQWRPHL